MKLKQLMAASAFIYQKIKRTGMIFNYFRQTSTLSIKD